MADEPFVSSLGKVSAYLDAKAHGYPGTREEFGEHLANAGTYFKRAEEAAEQAEGYARTASDAAEQTGEDARTASQAADTATDAAGNASRDAKTASDAANTASDAADTATQKAEDAELASGNAGQYASNADQSAQEARGYLDTVKANATAAAQSASNASASESHAAASEQHAQELVDTLPDDYAGMLEDVSRLNETKDIRTVSGDIVSFDSSYADMPLKKVTVDIDPVQDLRGYDYPWPAGGGKNKAGPMEAGTIQESRDAGTNYSGLKSSSTTRIRTIDLIPIGNNGQATISFDDSKYKIAITGFDSDGLYLGRTSGWRTFQTTSPQTLNWTNARYIIVILAKLDDSTITDSDRITAKLQVEADTLVATSYEPYSNICPITGWTGAKVKRTGKNLFSWLDAGLRVNPDNVDTTNKTIAWSASSNNGFNFSNGVIDFKPNTRYTFIIVGKRSNATYAGRWGLNLRIVYTDGSYSDIAIEITTEQIGEFVTLRFVSATNKTISRMNVVNNGGYTYVKYEESGIFEGVVPLENFESFGDTYNITFPSEAGTVYGGKLEINEDGSGVLTVDRAKTTISTFDGAWNDGEFGFTVWRAITSGVRSPIAKCDKFKYNGITESKMPVWTFGGGSGASSTFTFCLGGGVSSLAEAREWVANNPVEMVYEFATKRIYTLTTSQVITLLGANNIWADTGDVEVQYGAYISTVKNELGEKVPKLMIAPVEKTTTASKPYAVNEFLIMGDKLYIVTANIASGGTITVGTNVSETTIGAQITALLNA